MNLRIREQEDELKARRTKILDDVWPLTIRLLAHVSRDVIVAAVYANAK